MKEDKDNPSTLSTKNSFFYNLYNKLPIGAIVFKSDMTILFANESMKKSFSFNPHHIKNPLIGNVLQCSHLENSNFICGQAPNCKECALHNGIIHILKEKFSMDTLAIKHVCITNNHNQSKWFNVSGFSTVYQNEVCAVLFFEDITPYKKQEQLLLEQLKLDLATKTINKYNLLKLIKNLITSEKKQSFTICMTDFDDFKKINDQYGHIMGDKVLKIFSHISHKNIRPNDILGRYGGEEFIFIFLEATPEHTAKIIGSIQKELKNYFLDIFPHTVTFSAGLVQVDTKAQFSDSTHLIDQVDKLLYKAKEYGKNQIVTIDKVYKFK